MIKPNWEIFKAKFSENPQNNFEWFCYLLFCKEFHKPCGISRYKNQSAIETDPIELDDDVVGWQAKFYDTSLSSHKKDFLKSIEKAKRDYPKITKLIFYTNEQWGQNKGKDPKGKTEIDTRAKELNVLLVWRETGFFESEFVAIQNKNISKHFFALERSIFKLLEEQENHTQSVLNEIQTSFSFKNSTFEIDRNNLLQQLQDNSQQIVILSGVGGVGKTALIKKLFQTLTDKIPCYIFQASEFKIRNINEFFVGFSFSDFVKAHKDEKFKIIVIDSSEKILDLKNTDPLKEFLFVLIQDKWKIIFTTRSNYLENLIYEFVEIHNIVPLNILIKNLELQELSIISNNYSFALPKDEKLLELIKNPFYLNEYLKSYDDKEELKYSQFKDKLWNKKIKNSKPAREICFLQIAFERAKKGQFFIVPNCESEILDNELVKDGILGYEETGYFITHDIYEEWALEKIIQREFITRSSEQEFFKNIGESLPVRRCFRNWISEKLFLEDAEIKKFIEEVVQSENIEQFWQDEILVSILFSNYSKHFFDLFKDDLFKDDLLVDNQNLLRRLTFIIRIACKEVDDNFFTQLGIKSLNLFSLKYILTKPKGKGWENLIEFVFDNINLIGLNNINFILPLIYDWNDKNRKGQTTRIASLIALQYYESMRRNNTHFSDQDLKDKLLKTILYGSCEISEDLKIIFDQIIQNKWTNYRDPYFDLSCRILTQLEGIEACKTLPQYVLKLANLFWFKIPNNNTNADNLDLKVREKICCITERDEFRYFPASAFQTPIFWILQFDLKSTIDFILDFTNKVVQCLVENAGQEYFYKSTIKLKEQKIQYSNNDLWRIFRGANNTPYLLNSIHMALEKYFLDRGKNLDPQTLNNWLLYLLENSISASISAVVSSIVLAFPEKTFDVAKVLFQTQYFILFDKIRQRVDHVEIKSFYSMDYDLDFNNTNKIFADERIATCDHEHRKFSLEDQFRFYQLFVNREITGEEFAIRREVLWDILDNYYKELPDKTSETKEDKTWKLFLARMDIRKMDINTTKTENNILIQFNPEIDSDLKEYSEKSVAESYELMKYTYLKNWATLRTANNDQSKEYEKYENNPLLALQEVKDIVKQLQSHSQEDNFYLFNHSIPAYVCSCLLEHYFDQLSSEDKLFCKAIVLEVASSFLNSGYFYQISDGVQPAILALPKLLDACPENKEQIKRILFLALFEKHHVGGILSNECFSIFPITAIHKVWKTNFEDANSFLLAYLLLRPIYDQLEMETREENYKKGIYDFSEDQFVEQFLERNKDFIEDFIENRILFNNIESIKKLDLEVLGTTFQILPLKIEHTEHKKIAKQVIYAFARKVTSDNKEDRIDYKIKRDFLRKYAYVILNLSINEIQDFLIPFLDDFIPSESIADLFQEFILAEDKLNTNDNFWFVWNTFKEKIFEICQDSDEVWYVSKVIKSYLFAQTPWKDNAKEWYSLTDKNKRFFKEVSEKIGHCPSTLYCVAKLLNDIGSIYLDDGIDWIANILRKSDYTGKDLEINTIFYIENLVKKFSFRNREKIKKTKLIKDNLLIVLDFLVQKGSVIGYMVRELII